MHYQIPSEMLTEHFEEDVEVKPSEINRSTIFPNMCPGNGLFTKSLGRRMNKSFPSPATGWRRTCMGPKQALLIDTQTHTHTS